MADSARELILKQLLAIITTVATDNGGYPYRDQGDIEPKNPETKTPNLPGLILLDGSESQGTQTLGRGGQWGGLVPTTMVLEPQIYIALMPRESMTDQVTVGEELSMWRDKILFAIDQSDNLKGLLGGNGEMNYLGLQSDMHADGPMVGQAALKFSFTYTFNPRELS